MTWSFLKSFVVVAVLILTSLYLSSRVILGCNSELANPGDYSRHGQRPKLPLKNIQNATDFNPPFTTLGRNIIDTDGKRFRFFSVNWYGASDGGFVVGGLDRRHRSEIARTILSMGFNSVRLPYSDELLYRNPCIQPELLSANSDLWSKTALEVFAAVVESLTEAGLFVIINNHITQARWCCDGNPCDSSWSNSHSGPFCSVRQTEESWIHNLETIMSPHIYNPRVIGVDLRNEPRSIVDKFLWLSWASAAEHAANRLHRIQPNWLIIVEGISSANDISGAQLRPISLTVPNKLVYSVHIYGWSGWGSLSPFWLRSYEAFANEMNRNWAWVLDSTSSQSKISQGMIPVWIGEFGAPDSPNKGDLHYWNNLIQYVRGLENKYSSSIGLAYWAVNPRKFHNQEVEGYSLLEDDWETVKLDYRLVDMLNVINYTTHRHPSAQILAVNNYQGDYN